MMKVKYAMTITNNSVRSPPHYSMILMCSFDFDIDYFIPLLSSSSKANNIP